MTLKLLFVFTFAFITFISVRTSAQVIISSPKLNTDTIIGRKIITNEIAGSNYRKRATAYFIVVKNDTSNFKCILTESKDGGRVGMEIQPSGSSGDKKTYMQRMTELRKIIPAAVLDFKFDSLRTISIGTLDYQGDLAVDITKQYKNKFGAGTKITDYRKVSAFLLTSKLAADFNDLFRAYNLSVKRISVEKAYFTNKKGFLRSNKIVSDSALVPAKILTCMTWVIMGR